VRYITRESSPYSLASVDFGMEGWASFRNAVFNKPISQITGVVSKAGSQIAAESKRSPILKYSLYAVGAAAAGYGAFALYSAYGAGAGAVAAGSSAAATGSVPAAVAEGVAAQFAQASIPATIGSYGATVAGAEAAAASGITFGGAVSAVGAGLKTASSVLPAAMLVSKLMGVGQAAAAPGGEILMGGGNYGAPTGPSPFSGGGGGGGVVGGVPGETASQMAAVESWLPMLLIGVVAVAILTQRR
jgi:hypothetical protein